MAEKRLVRDPRLHCPAPAYRSHRDLEMRPREPYGDRNNMDILARSVLIILQLLEEAIKERRGEKRPDTPDPHD